MSGSGSCPLRWCDFNASSSASVVLVGGPGLLRAGPRSLTLPLASRLNELGNRERGWGIPMVLIAGGSVRSPSPVRTPAFQRLLRPEGQDHRRQGGRHPFPGRRSGVPVSVALGVGNRDAAALGRVMSPLPCRWFGEPLVPSDAFGVGSSSHSTSSARFGPCPRSSASTDAASRRSSRCCWSASSAGCPVGHAARKVRSRWCGAPTSEARSTSHFASYPRSARDPSTAPSARRAG